MGKSVALTCVMVLDSLSTVYDFKLKGGRILKGRYLPPPPPPLALCDLTFKCSNFFPIDRISGLENYVMFQHQVCLFSRNYFDFVCFPRF